MKKRFYIDTCIWIDLFEDRKSFVNEPLGDYAAKFFNYIMIIEAKLIVSETLLKELEKNFTIEQINGLFMSFKIEKIRINEKEKDLAYEISQNRNIPLGDVKHAILSKRANSVLITRDKHFKKLTDINYYQKPEDFIKDLN